MLSHQMNQQQSLELHRKYHNDVNTLIVHLLC